MTFFVLRRRLMRSPYRGAWPVAVAAVLVLAGALAYRLSMDAGLERLRAESLQRLDTLAVAVDGTVTRHAAIPAAVQVSEPVLGLLRAPTSERAALLGEVNRFLQRLNDHLGGPALFVMDASGRVVASSDWIYSTNLIGQDLSYMPFFRSAIGGMPARHYAVDPVRPHPGYYFAQPIRDERQGWKVVGVAVVKTSLRDLEQRWQRLDSPAAIVDNNRVVLMSNPPDWRYGSLEPLAGEAMSDFDPRPYADRATGLRVLALGAMPTEGTAVVRLPEPIRPAAGSPHEEDSFVVVSRSLPETAWRLFVLVGTKDARAGALVIALLVVAVLACLMLAATIALQQRRLAQSREQARRLADRSKRHLERLVAERTAELRAAVVRLGQEVAERRRAEQTLRDAQGELVQAAKLAVIGRMAAGITHELSQPLGAIRTLSENAIAFMNSNLAQVARQNLALIGRLVDQMGQIIQPLKGFSRKSPAVREQLDLAQVVDAALLLFIPRLSERSVHVERRFEPGQWFAFADSNRLQQVLVNLVGNALDAMDAVPERRIVFEASLGADAIELAVQDSGPGVDDVIRDRLFEPFFTTKPQGEGLGLGLAISRDILRDFDGDLRIAPGVGAGARFVISLPLPATQELRRVG